MTRFLDPVPLRTGVSIGACAVGPDTGERVIFLHGYTNSSAAWFDVLETLHQEIPRLSLIALDARGHGRSSLPNEEGWAVAPSVWFTVPLMAADVLAYMDAHDIETATIVGHSMGSLVAQEVALTAPDRVTRLVLISTTSDASHAPILSDWLINTVLGTEWRQAVESRGHAWPADTASLAPHDILNDPIGWMQTFWNVYPYRHDKPTIDAAEHAAHLPIGVWLGAADGILSFTSTNRLAALTTPTLILWGVQDAFFLRDSQITLLAKLDEAIAAGGIHVWKQYGTRPLDASGLQTDDLGHNLTWDDPQQVARDIATFIRTGTVR